MHLAERRMGNSTLFLAQAGHSHAGCKWPSNGQPSWNPVKQILTLSTPGPLQTAPPGCPCSPLTPLATNPNANRRESLTHSPSLSSLAHIYTVFLAISFSHNTLTCIFCLALSHMLFRYCPDPMTYKNFLLFALFLALAPLHLHVPNVIA